MQEELFDGFLGGEVFFANLNELLRRPDDPTTADLLEVHLLCLLLGFQGQYHDSDRALLDEIKRATSDKLARIRGASRELSPGWHPPDENPSQPSSNRVAKRLGLVAASATVLFIGCWTASYLLLRGA